MENNRPIRFNRNGFTIDLRKVLYWFTSSLKPLP